MTAQFLDFKVISKMDATAVLEQCQGKNQKGIFLLYAKDEVEELPFLKKVLQSVQLDFDQDVLSFMGDATTSFSVSDLYQTTSITKVLVFGLPPSQIGLQLHLSKYQAYPINNRTYLFADRLPDIAANKNLKGHLWKGLQELFA